MFIVTYEQKLKDWESGNYCAPNFDLDTMTLDKLLFY